MESVLDLNALDVHGCFNRGRNHANLLSHELCMANLFERTRWVMTSHREIGRQRNCGSWDRGGRAGHLVIIRIRGKTDERGEGLGVWKCMMGARYRKWAKEEKGRHALKWSLPYIFIYSTPTVSKAVCTPWRGNSKKHLRLQHLIFQLQWTIRTNTVHEIWPILEVNILTMH